MLNTGWQFMNKNLYWKWKISDNKDNIFLSQCQIKCQTAIIQFSVIDVNYTLLFLNCLL